MNEQRYNIKMNNKLIWKLPSYQVQRYLSVPLSKISVLWIKIVDEFFHSKK